MLKDYSVLLITYIPITTSVPDSIMFEFKGSFRNSQPKEIPNIGVKKAKLATPDAGYIDKSHSQKIKPMVTTTIDWKRSPHM